MQKIRKWLCVFVLSFLICGLSAELLPQGGIVMEVQATDKPATPELISAKQSGTSKIVIKWKKVAGVRGYRVYRKKSNGKWKAIKTIKNQNATSYTNTGIKVNTTYTYTVRAYKKVGNKTVWSSYDKTGVRTTILKTPELLSTTASKNSKITVKWNSVPKASGYCVYRKGESGSWKLLEKITGQKVNSYIDTTCKKGVLYSYTVRAYKKAGKITSLSSYDKAGVKNILLETPRITNVRMTSVMKTTVDVSFNGVKGASGYCLYRKTANTDWVRIADHIGEAADNTTYSNGNCRQGVIYYYSVRAYRIIDDTKVWSDYDNTGKSVRMMTTPSPYSTVATGAGEITFTWDLLDDVDGHRVYRKIGDGKWKKLKDLSGKTYKYVDTNVEIGKTYTYTVKSFVYENGKKLYSGYKAGKKLTMKIPAPENVTANSSDTGVMLNWNAINDVYGYRIYRRQEGKSTWKRLITLSDGKQNFYIDKTAETGRTYYYTVRGYVRQNGKNVWGKYDNTGQKVTLAIPVPELISAQTVGSNNVVLTWKAVPGVTGYQIYERVTDKSWIWSEIAEISGGEKVTYTRSNLEADTTYSYTVKAYKVLDGQKIWSDYNEKGISTKTERSELKLNTTDLVLIYGESFGLDLEGTTEQPIWYSSNEKVATVDHDGGIHTWDVGTALITGLFEGVEYVCNVKVEKPVMHSDEPIIETGDSTYVSINGITQDVTWSMGPYDDDLIKLDIIDKYKVKVTGLKGGRAFVYAKVSETTTLAYEIKIKGLFRVSTTKVTLFVGEEAEILIDSDYYLYVWNNNSSIVSDVQTNLPDDKYKVTLKGLTAGTTSIILSDAHINNSPLITKEVKVTVIDTDHPITNNYKLKNYILANGHYSEGWYTIAYSGYAENNPDVIYIWTISCDVAGNDLEFGLAMNAGEELLCISLQGDPSQMTIMKPHYIYENVATGTGFVAEASLNVNTYKGQNLTFKVIKKEGMKDSEINELKSIVNDALVLAFDGWNDYVLKDMGYNLNVLGFKAYPLL